jgi:hypothetical protein
MFLPLAVLAPLAARLGPRPPLGATVWLAVALLVARTAGTPAAAAS